MSGHLGCTSEPFGLKIAARGVTLDMNLFKIFCGAPETSSATSASSWPPSWSRFSAVAPAI